MVEAYFNQLHREGDQAMSTNTDSGSGQASRARTENKTINGNVDEFGKPLLSAEQARTLRMMESANDRIKVERLRKEAEERRLAERQWGKPAPKPVEESGNDSVF